MKKRGRKNKPELEQRLLDLARVTRVVRGGRRFRFRATVAAGNKNGKVGIGIAKGPDVSEAISKAFNKARKSLVSINVYKGTIPHEMKAKYKSAKVILKPAKKGRGVVVGGAVRQVVELAGISNMSAKILGKGSKVTNALAALKGLSQLKTISDMRGANNVGGKREKIVESGSEGLKIDKNESSEKVNQK